MTTLEQTGKTYEEALMAGLAAMGLPSDKVDVEVLEEGSRGFLGLGARPYRLRLVKKDTPAIRAEEFLKNVTERMGLDVALDIREDEEALRIEMQGDEYLGVVMPSWIDHQSVAGLTVTAMGKRSGMAFVMNSTNKI